MSAGTRPAPARVEQQAPARRRDPLWARLFVLFGALLMVGAGGAVVAKNVLFNYATRSVAEEDLLGSAGSANLQRGHVDITGAKNVLLVGTDQRPWEPEGEDLVRADSIIILHIPADHESAYLVSIPRDTWVEVPAFDNGVKKIGRQYSKINGAFGLGGSGLTGTQARAKSIQLLALTIKEHWQITFDAAAIVDFTGFKEVVNVLGGVDMHVDQEVISVHIGFTASGEQRVPFKQYDCDRGTCLQAIPGVTPKKYTVGYQHLEPWEALDYVRQRETLENSDYDRQRHQQQFIKALFKKMLSKNVIGSPLQFNKVLEVVGKAMTIDAGGIDLEDWAFAMKGIGGDDLVTVKTNNGTYNASPDNRGAEALDERTLELLTAVRANRVQEFLATHPDLATQS
jgi:polyisoprenyl-teichoic acid--peptidoglycan teichoic acid transferase